jgi:hypothetical protein
VGAQREVQLGERGLVFVQLFFLVLRAQKKAGWVGSGGAHDVVSQ